MSRRVSGLRAQAMARAQLAERPAALPIDPWFVPACFLFHFGLFAALPWIDGVAAGLVTVALGLSSMQLVVIAHDGMHNSLKIPLWTHTLVGRLLSTYSLVPYHYLRHSHLTHHRRAGLIEGDTEILHPTRAVAAARPELRFAAWFNRSPLAPLVLWPSIQSAGLLRLLFRPERTIQALAARRGTVIDLALGVGFWSALFLLAGWPVALRLAILGLALPMVIGMSLMHVGVFPLHTGMLGASLHEHSPRARAFLLSRTFESNALMRFLIGNANYHIEHHLWPQLDRWQLADHARAEEPALRALAEKLGVPYQRHRSYLAWFRRYLGTRDVYNEIEDPSALVKGNERYQGT